MKRSNFLKALLGIAVAPVAIAKAIEQCDVKNILDKDKESYGLKVAKEFEKQWIEGKFQNHSAIIREKFDVPKSDLCKIKTGEELEIEYQLFTIEMERNRTDGIEICEPEFYDSWEEKLKKRLKELS